MPELMQRNVPIKLFDAVALHATDVSSSVAIPILPSGSLNVLTWRTAFASDPSAINVAIQIAMNDVAAEYATLDSSTYITGGELRVVVPLAGRFLRAKQVSNTGGTGLTVEVTIT